MTPPPSKRPRTRSPSPSLPAHLLAPLSSSHSFPSASAAQPHSADPALARLLPHLAHGATAHEARLLDPRAGDEPRRVPRPVRWVGRRDGEVEGEEVEVSTDRYDILHLFSSLPPAPPPAPSSSSRGFAALPPTHEELFFLTPSERTAVAQRARRREMEEEREARVRAAEERDERERVEREERDEAVKHTQLALMRRLDATLSSSPNPALLEMRILANHGADPRFAFLRPGARGGRWREVWERMRRGERVGEEEGEEREEGDERGKGKEGGGMAGLAAYGSSDEEEEDEVEEVAEAKGVDDSAPPAAEPRPAAAADIVTSAPEPAPPGAPPASPPDHAPDEDDLARLAKREARALRAREWARRRREAREGAPNDAA